MADRKCKMTHMAFRFPSGTGRWPAELNWNPGSVPPGSVTLGEYLTLADHQFWPMGLGIKWDTTLSEKPLASRLGQFSNCLSIKY